MQDATKSPEITPCTNYFFFWVSKGIRRKIIIFLTILVKIIFQLETTHFNNSRICYPDVLWFYMLVVDSHIVDIFQSFYYPSHDVDYEFLW